MKKGSKFDDFLKDENIEIDEEIIKENAELKAENEKLKSCLQEIKAIANTRFVNGLNEEADIYNADMDRILDLITKTEEE